MMRDNVFQGRSYQRGESGTSRTDTYSGTLAEMTEVLESLDIGSGSGENHIASANMTQIGGALWKVEVQYEDSSSGSFVSPPAKEYGKKSAQLGCGVVSMPLECAKKYQARWNHYLFAAVKENETTSVPSWWETAKSTCELSGADAKKYRWGSSLSELPIGADRQGRIWKALCDPTKPGVNGFDIATVQITISSGFPNPQRAGAFVGSRINQLAAPAETFQYSRDDSMWKVDSASIRWNGKRWIATLTHTMAGNDRGWDSDFYT